MKKIITLILSLVMVCSIGLFATSCGCKGNTSKMVNVRTKNITVGYTIFAPMNYTENKVFKGFDTELALMVFNALGYEVNFKEIVWENKYLDLNTGTIDCIWNGFTSNSTDKNANGEDIARSESVDFSYNYMINEQCIVRGKNSTNVTDVSGFANKLIAFESGSAGESFVDSTIISKGNVTIAKREKSTQMEALSAVEMGASDYAIVDKSLAESVIASGNYTNVAINEGIEIPIEYYAIGFKKGSTLTAQVNVMLDAFAKTGQLMELAKKYKLENRIITNFGV